MPNDAVPRPVPPSSPILDRFRLLLRERDADFSVSFGDVNGVIPPPPSTAEIVRFYEDVLSELTFNSKPIITDLTIIAGEQREHAQGIAEAICARVLEVSLSKFEKQSSEVLRVSVDQKLPSLYLLDSIVKNIGREYVRHFASRLPEVFCETYRQVPPHMHSSMRHLFRTWSTVFPSSILRKIEDELQFSPGLTQPSSSLANMRSSESPRPSHGIHVNPKYLEARRQLDSTSVTNGNFHNIQLGRGVPSFRTSQKQCAEYEDYDYHQGEGSTSCIDAPNFSSLRFSGRTSFPLSTDKLLSSASSLARPLSPSVEDLSMSNSPGRLYERESPSRSGYNFGRRRGRDEETSDWQKRLRSDESYHGFENASKYGSSNGFEHERPRALIDAYGHDDGQRPLNEKPLGLNRLIVNGAASKVADTSWQNTEEEEFDWEDMSPTLTDGKNSSIKTSALSLRAIRGVLEADQLSSNKPTLRNEMNLSQGAWRIPDSLSVPTPVAGQENASRLSLPANGMPSSADHFVSVPTPLVRVSNVTSRVVSSGLNSFEARAPSPVVAPVSTVSWPPPASSHNLMPLPPKFPPQNQPRASFDFRNQSYSILNQGQQYESDDKRNSVPIKPGTRPQFSFTPLHHLTQPPPPLQQQLHRPQEPRLNTPAVPPLPPHMRPPSVCLGFTPVGPGNPSNNILCNPLPASHSSVPIQNVSNGSVQFQSPMAPLPLMPRPLAHLLPIPQSSGPLVNQPPTVAISGLLNSLVAQGLLKQTPVQDSLGVDFNPDALKVRHESAIKALYEDLPRQCTTCGLRFKTQEDHSKHMDWHVTKNRISKNRKHNPSRKWFVSVSMWLSGAEALGTDSTPGFLPTESVIEMKDDEELAVPADEDQNTCALCGEPFEDFYSDEAEEWMYRGAVYMNAPHGSAVGMDRSQLGPIVHAKCRPDTSATPT